MEMDDDMAGNNSQYMYNQDSPGLGNDMEESGNDEQDLIAEQDHLLHLRDALEMKTDEESREDIL